MKKNTLHTFFCLFLFCFFTANAQHIGVKVGYNYASFSGTSADNPKTSATHAFYGGGFVEFPLGDDFSLQPEILYARQGAKVSFTDALSLEERAENFQLDYLKIPLLAKINLNKLSLFVAPQLGFLVNTPDISLKSGDLEKKAFNSVIFSLGVGASYWISPSIIADVRYSRGLSPVFNKESEELRRISISDKNDLKHSVISVGVGFLIFKDHRSRINRLFNTPK